MLHAVIEPVQGIVKRQARITAQPKDMLHAVQLQQAHHRLSTTDCGHHASCPLSDHGSDCSHHFQPAARSILSISLWRVTARSKSTSKSASALKASAARAYAWATLYADPVGVPW